MNSSEATAHATEHTVDLDGTLITLTDRGAGRPVLLLHGGGGPQTVTPWADTFAAVRPVRVLTPVHPGFGGTPRPESLDSIRGLAALYRDLVDRLGLQAVTVVGNSIGGWIAAEMAILGSERVGGYVLVDAVGIDVAGHPVADFFNLDPAELADLAYADPSYGIDPSTLPPEALAEMAGNRAALRLYAGTAMTDPTLLARLVGVDAPTTVIWGEADRIGDLALGRAFADAIAGASFEVVRKAGHLPQIEQPEALAELVWDAIASPRR